MQKTTKYTIVLISTFVTIFGFSFCYRFEPNTLLLKNATECAGEEKNMAHINQTITPVARNKYMVNGELTFVEYFPGHLEVQVISQRCDLNKTHCQHFDSFVVCDICKILNLQDQLWSDFMVHTEPKLKCPFGNSTIKIKDAAIDLGYVAHLPLDGHTWTFTVKVFKPGATARHKKRFMFCMTFEVTVQKMRPDRRKTPKPKTR